MSVVDEVEEEIPIYLSSVQGQELQVWNFPTRVRGYKYGQPDTVMYASDKESVHFWASGVQNNVSNISEPLEFVGNLQKQAKQCVYGLLLSPAAFSQDATQAEASPESFRYILLPITKFYQIMPQIDAGEDLKPFLNHFQVEGQTLIPFQRIGTQNEFSGPGKTEGSIKNDDRGKMQMLSVETNVFTTFRHVHGKLDLNELLGDKNRFSTIQATEIIKSGAQPNKTIPFHMYSKLLLQTQGITKPMQRESLETIVSRLLASRSIVSLSALFSFIGRKFSQIDALNVARNLSMPYRGYLAIKRKYLKASERPRILRDFILFYFGKLIKEKSEVKRIWRVQQFLKEMENDANNEFQVPEMLRSKLEEVLEAERSKEEASGYFCALNVQEKSQLDELLPAPFLDDFLSVEGKITEFQTSSSDASFDREYFLYFARGCAAAELSDAVFRFNIAQLDSHTLQLLPIHLEDDTYQNEYPDIYQLHLNETKKTVEDTLKEALLLGPGPEQQIESRAKRMQIIREYQEGF